MDYDPILKTLPTTLELAEKEFLNTYAIKVKPSSISVGGQIREEFNGDDINSHLEWVNKTVSKFKDAELERNIFFIKSHSNYIESDRVELFSFASNMMVCFLTGAQIWFYRKCE